MWACISSSFPHPIILLINPRRFSISAAAFRRHHRRRRHVTPHPSSAAVPPDHDNLKLVIDTDNLRHQLSEVVSDLRTLVVVDSDHRRLTLSCRRPTAVFIGTLAFSLLLLFSLFKALIRLKLVGIMNSRREKGGVYRMDRSLGGKQVLVGKMENKMDYLPRQQQQQQQDKRNVAGRRRDEERRRLPGWWPVSVKATAAAGEGKEVYQKMADRFIRAILDQRIIGNDISAQDIVQFRRLCRGSGVTVFIETANARDSFYRASVDFVLKVCESVDYHSMSVNIDGEDPRQFVAGIAGNIGVEDFHAARIVTASIAARTRSCFLQAWALEIQGKHSEAAAELSKIGLLHREFPPEENSPEMEMVARGLGKHLKLEQRKLLMGMLSETCKDGNKRSVAEALGLVSLPEFGISSEAS